MYCFIEPKCVFLNALQQGAGCIFTVVPQDIIGVHSWHRVFPANSVSVCKDSDCWRGDVGDLPLGVEHNDLATEMEKNMQIVQIYLCYFFSGCANSLAVYAQNS